MSWKRIRERRGKNYLYSIAGKLRRERRSNEEFEVMISGLSLEEVIALKLELSSKPVNNRLYGINIWSALPDIARDAAFKFAYSATRSHKEAMRFLGMAPLYFQKFKWKYDPVSYFTENDKKDI
tara:strand:+ start:630 stop:1001 length:372 start_codon:yes stop_codon:yes gene_type:complete